MAPTDNLTPPPSNVVPITPPDDGKGDYEKWLERKFGRSYRTTIAGIALFLVGGARLILGVVHHTLTPEDALTSVGLMMGGGGLGVTKDQRVHGDNRP